MVGKEGELLRYETWWGSHFFEEMSDGSYKPTVWAHMFQADIRGTIANLNCLH